ncbi:hypothetical protein BDV96DRAFT_647406 [Lophiotrema nucula]|uniref:Uncharacterized protein n=1 Tax=Lophiotrema nucula TaxID=690887 RepID=A0A6A5Z487_9PLEO|nr:hypothetical protein BDV96DRAFT_647406 [Lophiotrema nucula]
MYRYPEPVWRQPRPGSHERSARPTSLISEQASRTSARELGPSSATLKLPSVATSGFKAAEDDGYSYSDPAGMYYDTEPAWRRPRAGSPTSRIMERAPRTSARELSPPPAAVEFPFIDSNHKSHARYGHFEFLNQKIVLDSIPKELYFFLQRRFE